jgi:hypothetical protein
MGRQRARQRRSEGWFNENTVICPSGTNWMVVDRRSGSDVTVVCYQR